MGHLDSQRSLPTLGPDRSGLSALAKKLRMVAGQRVLVLNAPNGYLALLSPGPADMRTAAESNTAYDNVVVFAENLEQLRRFGPVAIRATRPDGLLWIAYPKGGKTKGVTDLPASPWWVSRDVVGDVTGEKGYKAVSLMSIDETWTALRFKKV